MASILIIDDDRDFRTYAAAILERKGHEVAVAGSSRLVVRALRERRLRGHFDLAVVDILMPEVSGIEVIRTFKQAYPGARIVAVSGGGTWMGVENRLEVAKRFGAAAVLAKPFTSYDLCGTVDQTLELAA